MRPHIEGALESGIGIRRLHLSAEEAVRILEEEKPSFHRPVTSSDAVSKNRRPKPYGADGVMTPQGWLLSKVIPFEDQLKDLTQTQADEIMAKTLQVPRSWAVLLRNLGNLHPGLGTTRNGLIARSLMKPEVFFGKVTDDLMVLARRIDALSAEEWSNVEVELRQLHNQPGLSLLGTPLVLHMESPYDLPRITQDAFQTGASMSAQAAFGHDPVKAASEFESDSVSNDVYVAAGRASLELILQRELREQGHKFSYLQLFAPKRDKKEEDKMQVQVVPARALPAPQEEKKDTGRVIKENREYTLVEESGQLVTRPPIPQAQPRVDISRTGDSREVLSPKLGRRQQLVRFAKQVPSAALYLGGAYTLFQARVNHGIYDRMSAPISPQSGTIRDIGRMQDNLRNRIDAVRNQRDHWSSPEMRNPYDVEIKTLEDQRAKLTKERKRLEDEIAPTQAHLTPQILKTLGFYALSAGLILRKPIIKTLGKVFGPPYP